MSSNNLEALQGINALLILIANAAAAIGKINVAIGQAQFEGRDISDEELKEITDATDAKHAELMERLKAISGAE